MKKHLITLVALAGFAVGASIAYGGATAGSGIVGSKHDMNVYGGTVSAYNGSDTTTQTLGDDSQGRVCAFCHTPHHALDPAQSDYLPLWSHNLSTGAYTPYNSLTFDGAVTDPLAGPSRLCMSCHDGVIAQDQHYGNAGSNITSDANLTGDNYNQIAVGLNKDLSNDHPIGFDITNYPGDDAAKTGGMQIFGTAIRANLQAPHNTTLNNKVFTSVGFDTGAAKLFTCASCHDVHNVDTVENYFLYEKQAGSDICLMCHIK